MKNLSILFAFVSLFISCVNSNKDSAKKTRNDSLKKQGSQQTSFPCGVSDQIKSRNFRKRENFHPNRDFISKIQKDLLFKKINSKNLSHSRFDRLKNKSVLVHRQASFLHECNSIQELDIQEKTKKCSQLKKRYFETP